MVRNLQGKEPDYRFSLANERTFLAWLRTALALLAGGVLLKQFSLSIEQPRFSLALSAGLMIISGLVAVGAYLQWSSYQKAMRLDEPLPRSWLILGLAIAVLTLALTTAWATLWS